ncbi:MAG: hypothetical protein IKB01_06725, partial [Lachnospiraceae bacterium]|nr:hypothetical protein [Lachnospiraceae bacterium]
CEGESIPYIYPLNVGKNIKKELVEEKIYVPTLWGHIAENGDKNSWEYELAENTIFLPLDQRYGMDDITYIINCVKEKLARK